MYAVTTGEEDKDVLPLRDVNSRAREDPAYEIHVTRLTESRAFEVQLLHSKTLR